MVAGQAEPQHRADRNRPIPRHRGRSDGSDGEYRRLGGSITAMKSSIPNMPRFDTVNVPPDSSGAVTVPVRTRPARARVSAAI